MRGVRDDGLVVPAVSQLDAVLLTRVCGASASEETTGLRGDVPAREGGAGAREAAGAISAEEARIEACPETGAESDGAGIPAGRRVHIDGRAEPERASEARRAARRGGVHSCCLSGSRSSRPRAVCGCC